MSEQKHREKRSPRRDSKSSNQPSHCAKSSHRDVPHSKPVTKPTPDPSQPVIKDWYPFCVVYDPIQAGSIDSTDTIPHDRAIIRAMNSTYTPNTALKTNPKHTLFVGRLNKNTREDDLSNAFGRFGTVRDVKLIRDIITGVSKRYAFIEFENERACVDAIRDMNRTNFQGAEILVDFEAGRNLKGWVPRRLGGGWGGNKNSGQLRFGGRNKPWVKPVQLMNEGELRMWRRQNDG